MGENNPRVSVIIPKVNLWSLFFVSHVSNKYGAGRSLLSLIDGLLQISFKNWRIKCK